MKDLITKAQKHLLYQDELGEQFLFLEYAEVFKYSDKILRLHSWKSDKVAILRQKGLVLNEQKTDDPLFIVDVKITALPFLLSLHNKSRRLSKTSKKFLKLEKLLAHKILPYRPRLAEVEELATV